MTDKIKVSREVYDYVKEHYRSDEEYEREFGSLGGWDEQGLHHEIVWKLGDLHWRYEQPDNMSDKLYDLLYQHSKLGNWWPTEVMRGWPGYVPPRTLSNYEICDEAPTPPTWEELKEMVKTDD